MKFLDTITKPAFSWFDLVFIVIAFTLIRDAQLPSAFETLGFVAIGAVVGAEQAWVRPWITSRLRHRGRP